MVIVYKPEYYARNIPLIDGELLWKSTEDDFPVPSKLNRHGGGTAAEESVEKCRHDLIDQHGSALSCQKVLHWW